MTVGERVKRLRIERGMTQDELAEKIGYKSRATINKIESGEREMPQKMIVKFADALGTSPNYIVGWDYEVVLSSEDKEIVDAMYEDENIRIMYTAISNAKLSEDKKKQLLGMINGFIFANGDNA